MNLQGRRLLVSGAAGGIGTAVARRLTAEGAVVGVTDLDLSKVTQLARGLSEAVGFACDLSMAGEAERLVDDVEEQIGPLDGLVHCAAVGKSVAMLDCTLEVWSEMLAVNLTATFDLCQAVAKRLVKKRSGVLVALASGAGIRPNAANVPYGAAKAGVIGLIRSAAIDLAPFGVRANVLIPGPTQTPLMRQIAGAAVPLLTARTMLGRLGQPDEIAAVAAFLVSDQARYMTGSVLFADGGFSNSGVDFR